MAKDHVKMTIEEELKDIGARLEKIEVELSSLVKEGRIGKNERQLLWMAGIVVSVLVASVGFGQSDNSTLRFAGTILMYFGVLLSAFVLGTLSGMGVFKRRKKN